jgi:UDPglucose--hexose-1-phosphate uridylyltransferase
MSMQELSHSRKNLLTNEWVLVSPHRTQRPWQGQLEPADTADITDFDPQCYLCPGNERANGNRNPDYQGPYVFDNDFPALSNERDPNLHSSEFFEARPETGCCRVVCFSEQHDQRLSTMTTGQVQLALGAMFNEFQKLDQQADISYVQVFENRGQMMGCSNPHPHAQIWATSELPTEPAKELQTQRQFWDSNKRTLLGDYLQQELQKEERIVGTNEHFVALVPFWAVWPFETMVIPRREFAAPGEMQDEETHALADILKRTLASYDALFNVPAPYSMGFHPRPSDGEPHPEWVFHAHLYPPLLRSASIRKHLVGFEMLGMPQRDITPELAAEKLKACFEAWSL